MIKVQRVGDHTHPLPARSSAEAAGYDLVYSASAKVSIYPGAQAMLPTGYAWAIPYGMVGLIRPRSGLALQRGIDVQAGVIDADYRGQVGVILINHGHETVIIEPGQRIAQMVVLPCLLTDVSEVSDLDETERGAGGFGSTGL